MIEMIVVRRVSDSVTQENNECRLESLKCDRWKKRNEGSWREDGLFDAAPQQTCRKPWCHESRSSAFSTRHKISQSLPWIPVQAQR